MAVDHVLAEPLAQEHFGFATLDRVGHEANDVERQLRERAAHLVEAVLGLDDDLVEAVVHGPDFLLLGEGAEVVDHHGAMLRIRTILDDYAGWVHEGYVRRLHLGDVEAWLSTAAWSEGALLRDSTGMAIRAPHPDHAHGVAGVQLLERRLQIAAQSLAERVQLLGPVQRDRGNA